jgi:hypothetical protein
MNNWKNISKNQYDGRYDTWCWKSGIKNAHNRTIVKFCQDMPEIRNWKRPKRTNYREIGRYAADRLFRSINRMENKNIGERNEENHYVGIDIGDNSCIFWRMLFGISWS